MRSHLVRNAALVGVLFAVGTAHAQELLSNADLNATSVSTMIGATPTGWDAAATRVNTGVFNDGLSSEGFANQPTSAAGQFGVFFKPFSGGSLAGGNFVTASLTQFVPGTPGLPYTLTGYAGAGAGYIGLSDPTVTSKFKLEFLSGAFTPIGAAELDLVAAGLGTPNGNNFQYKQFNLSAVAPAGTVFVRVGAEMGNAYGNPAGGDQAFVVDNFSLTVPEPTSLAFLGLAGVMCVRRRK